MGPATARVTVDVDGRQLTLSNLGKVLYAEAGVTKGEVIDYYSRIAPVLLPHLADRALTVKRYPNGIDDHSFYEKNAPRGTPDWVRTETLPVPGSTKNRETIDYVVVEELATLVWLANLAALELHVPQWRVSGQGAPQPPDLVVFDLDPGPPATVVECMQVALALREVVTADGLVPFVKTSGSKGLQVSVPVRVGDAQLPSAYAHAIARRLEREQPDLVVSRMTKVLRPGKVLVDWSQNNPAKTTVSVYSLRARPGATVSTPLTWTEVEAANPVAFNAAQVLTRVERLADLHAGALDDRCRGELTAAMLASG